jgi:WD40 repeat protein
VTDLAFSPQSDRIVSVGGDALVKIWSLEGKLLQTLKGHKTWINAVTFSLDGQMIATASGDKTVILWKRDENDMFQATPYRVLQDHKDWVWDVAFSPDSQLIASAGKDDTVKLWNRDGKLLKTLRGHHNWVRAVAFSPDGNKLASGSADKTAILWTLDSLEELQAHSQDLGVKKLLVRGCELLHDYLMTNPKLEDSDRKLCDEKGTGAPTRGSRE